MCIDKLVAIKKIKKLFYSLPINEFEIKLLKYENDLEKELEYHESRQLKLVKDKEDSNG